MIQCSLVDVTLGLLRDRKDVTQSCQQSIDDARGAMKDSCPAFESCSMDVCERLQKLLGKCSRDLNKKGSRVASSVLEKYEQEQEEQEEYFQRSCDIHRNGDTGTVPMPTEFDAGYHDEDEADDDDDDADVDL